MHPGTTNGKTEFVAVTIPPAQAVMEAPCQRCVADTRERGRCSTKRGCAAIRNVPHVERGLAQINAESNGSGSSRIGRRRAQRGPGGAVANDLAGGAKKSCSQDWPGRPLSGLERRGSRREKTLLVAVENRDPEEVDLRQEHEARGANSDGTNVNRASHSPYFT